MTNSNRNNEHYCATIGFFDGVHRGHRYIIDRLCADARQHGMGSMVITFAQHPRKVLQKDFVPKLLSPAERKLELLGNTEVDKVVSLDFTIAMSKMTALDFMRMMYQELGVRRLIIGYDNRFGHNRTEGFEDYVAYGRELGIEVICNDELPNCKKSVSSSKIRQSLVEGDIKAANEGLGYKYSFSGVVVHGKGEGRKLGFPTANMNVDKEQLIPKRGVYAVEVKIDEKRRLLGMMNIGIQPTYGEYAETIEVNILDFDEDIYDREISVSVVERMRDERRFESLESLRNQLYTDRENIRKIFAE